MNCEKIEFSREGLMIRGHLRGKADVLVCPILRAFAEMQVQV